MIFILTLKCPAFMHGFGELIRICFHNSFIEFKRGILVKQTFANVQKEDNTFYYRTSK